MSFFFFFNDTATTEIYTLSLHDALPISFVVPECRWRALRQCQGASVGRFRLDRKSTRLNSSHLGISYAVFCLKKKKIPVIVATPMLRRTSSFCVLTWRNPTRWSGWVGAR